MKLYNFLLKCESATLGKNWNVVDTPEMKTGNYLENSFLKKP